ncbi:MAG: porin [Planctomycetota bacterium]
MNKLVYSAVALTLASAPGVASEKEWSSLDKELESLTSSLSAQNTGPKVGGWIHSSWRHSSDVEVETDPTTTPPTTEDQSGFQLDTVRLEITGDAGSDYGYKLSFDFAEGIEAGVDANGDDVTLGGIASLKDAYATWKIGDIVNGKMGRFKQPFLRSALVSDNRLLFLQRTGIGELVRRDLGLAFSGDYDTVHWWIAAQNGGDGQADEYLFTGRVTADLMGSSVGKVEGAYGAGDETALFVGAQVADEGTLDDGMFWGIEAALTAGPIAISAEMVDFDKGSVVGGNDEFGVHDPILSNIDSDLATSDVADTTPWNATASYMFTEMYEAAVRYEDSDNDEDTNAFHVAVNRYVQGHDIKWTLQWTNISSDATLANPEGDITQIGVGLGVSF